MTDKTLTQAPLQAADTHAVSAQSAVSQNSENVTSSQATPEPKNEIYSEPKMSKGEKLYDWGVYDGLNFWINLGSSVAIADVFCNGKGQKWIDKGANGIANMLAKSHPEKYAKVFGQSQTALRTLTLLSGGWALLAPMKYLEDNKRPIVHWLNNKLGVDQTAQDGHELKSNEIYIEKEQPKQSWANVIVRRLGATLAVVVAGQAINEGFRNRAQSKAYKGKDDPFGGKTRIEDFVTKHVNKGLNSGYVPGGKAIASNGMFQRYLGLTALDTIFTKITAVVMEVTNGAKKVQLPTEVPKTNHPLVNTDRLNKFTLDEDGIPDNPPEHDHNAVPAKQAKQESFVQRIRPKGPITAEPVAEQNTPYVERAQKSDSYTALTDKNTAPPTLAV